MRVRIQSHSAGPVRIGSRTHRPVKLVGTGHNMAVKPEPETPKQTSRRTTAGQTARLARAMKGNRYLHMTR